MYVLIMSRTSFSESTLYSRLNVKDLLAQNRREIWSLSDCNRTRTHNHLVHKTNAQHEHLNIRLRTKWFWVRVPLQSLNSNVFRILLTIYTSGISVRQRLLSLKQDQSCFWSNSNITVTFIAFLQRYYNNKAFVILTPLMWK